MQVGSSTDLQHRLVVGFQIDLHSRYGARLFLRHEQVDLTLLSCSFWLDVPKTKQNNTVRSPIRDLLAVFSVKELKRSLF